MLPGQILYVKQKFRKNKVGILKLTERVFWSPERWGIKLRVLVSEDRLSKGYEKTEDNSLTLLKC